LHRFADRGGLSNGEFEAGFESKGLPTAPGGAGFASGRQRNALMIIDDLDFVSVALVPPRNSQRKTAGAARSRGSRCFIPNTQAPRG